jgi:hypothetical protein
LRVGQGKKRSLSGEQILTALMINAMVMKLKKAPALYGLPQSSNLTIAHVSPAAQQLSVKYGRCSPFRKGFF